MIIKKSNGRRGILYSKFRSYGKFWRKSTILGGGTWHPRTHEKTFFSGETAGLKDIFIDIGPKQILDTIKTVGWRMENVDKVIVHQVSLKSFDLFVKQTGIPREKLIIVLPEYGNMVAASIPAALALAEEKNQIKKGNKIILVGLAAGVSVATFAIIW
jgi:3-oxoacyl-[acyl-carrier-protein] synthase-3